MQLVDIAQSFGLFFIVCLATAAVLSLAMLALARVERATVPAGRTPRRWAVDNSSAGSADRVSSAGGCTYRASGR